MPSSLHPAVRDLLDQFGAAVPDAAGDAEAALEWMLGDDDLSAITQFGLQQFLWYELPFKWMVEPAVRLEIAAHLGAFLRAAGFSRYAGLATGDTTHDVLAAWAIEIDAGYQAFRDAMAASGVEPPDLPELQWGVVMGRREHTAFWSTAAALEIATVTGDLPSGRRAAAARVEVARAHLTLERPDLGGESLLTALERERIEAWAKVEQGGARAQLLDPVVAQILAPVAVKGHLHDSLAPLRAVLAAADGEGCELTSAGYLPRILVADIVERFEWLYPGARAPRSEADVPQVGALHELARERRLVRRKGKRLVLTPRGREALASDDVLVADLATALLGDGFRAAAAEVLLASLLGELGRPARDRIAEAGVALTEEGWTVRGQPTGSPVPASLVEDELWRLRHLALLFRWVTFQPLSPVVDLTPEGRLVARIALRRLATAPRAST